MLDIQTRLATLKRPSLLTRAAQFGVDDYRREVHLRGLLNTDTMPRPAAAIMALLDCEAQMEAWRKEGSGHYRPARHVEVLIAILGETRLMRATAPTVV